MKSIVQAGIVIILAVLCIPMVPAQSVSEYSPSGKITGWGGLAIDYDIQGLKITEFEDRSVLRGYPTGSKVTIIFKVSGPYSIEGNWATDFFISLNGKEIEKVRAPYQGGAPGWSYSPKPIEIDITDDIKKNGFTLFADVGYARSENAEDVSLRVVGLKATESSTEGNAVTGILEPVSQTITKFWETISESDCNLKVDIETEEKPKLCDFLVKVADTNSEEPILGATLKITITNQQNDESRTLEATTDKNGEYRWTEKWKPNDLGKTYLVDVSATKDSCSPDDTSILVIVPKTTIVGDVLEIVLYKPPMTEGYVWICPEEIDDVSNLNECWPPSAPFWTTWDEDGKFELLDYRNYHQTNDYPILQKGRYRVWAWASGYLPTNVLVDVKEEKTAQANLRLATSLRRLDFHVVDSKGRPVEGAEISLSLPGTTKKVQAKTDSQGISWLQLQGTLFPCQPTTYNVKVNTGTISVAGTLTTSIPYCNGPLDFGATTNLTGSMVWDTAKTEIKTKIIKIVLPEPSDAAAWASKGNAFYNQGKYDDAIQAYNEAIKLDPNDANAWTSKGNAFYDQGKYDDAIQAYNEAIKLDPNDANAWNGKGNAFDDQGKYDDAIQAYNEAIKLDPNDANAWNGKGNAFISQGKYDDGITACDQAIQLEPDFKEARYNKGTALYDQGRYDDAIQAYNEAIKIDPNYVNAWIGKGTTLYDQGKYDDAIQAYNEAIKLDPNDAVAWYSKGFALKAIGHASEADAAYARAKQLGYTG